MSSVFKAPWQMPGVQRGIRHQSMNSQSMRFSEKNRDRHRKLECLMTSSMYMDHQDRDNRQLL